MTDEKPQRTIAKRTSHTRNFLINQAVEHSLEDLEDIYLAEQVLEEIKTGNFRIPEAAEKV